MIGLSSTRRGIAYALVLIAIFCVLAVFFFPTLEGPYSAVNGPVTALLSARAAAGLRSAIVCAGLTGLPLWFVQSIAVFFVVLFIVAESVPIDESAGQASILRC